MHMKNMFECILFENDVTYTIVCIGTFSPLQCLEVMGKIQCFTKVGKSFQKAW